MTPGTVYADLEPTGHPALHRLPVTTSGESLRRRCRDLDQDRAHCRPSLGRAGIQELTSRDWLVRGIVLMPTKERNIVRIVG